MKNYLIILINYVKINQVRTAKYLKVFEGIFWCKKMFESKKKKSQMLQMSNTFNIFLSFVPETRQLMQSKK